MDFTSDFDTFTLHAFWSKEIMVLVDKMVHIPAKSYAGQHDLVLNFINDTLFERKGVFNKEFRVKGQRYPDFKIPVKEAKREFEIVELKLRTSQLKYLREELKQREEIFSTSDCLYFSYLLQVVPKEGKPILKRNCIYYLVIIKMTKHILTLPLNELISEIKMGTKHFTEKLKEKSGIDEEKEELLGVDNIIKAVDLERKLSEKEYLLEEERKLRIEKEKQLEEKDKIIDKKDKEIEQLKAQLKKK